jgi:hypothetical protein
MSTCRASLEHPHPLRTGQERVFAPVRGGDACSNHDHGFLDEVSAALDTRYMENGVIEGARGGIRGQPSITVARMMRLT